MDKSNYNKVGVLIGRFQTPYLHEGHLAILKEVTNLHSQVIVFLGVPRIQNTKRNPLDFETRKKLIESRYPNIMVVALYDNRSDEKWSEQIDTLLNSIYPEKEIILYGSRDSFIPHYHGKHKTKILNQVATHNASEIRESIAANVLSSTIFRAGVIYGIYKQRPVTYPTVDIAVVNGAKKQLLLARKPNEDKFRFVGGFVDRTDVSYEAAARRELYEETKLSGLTATYITSQQIIDWRYQREESGIMTTLYLFYDWDQMGKPEASDDIEELKWFNLSDLYKTQPNTLEMEYFLEDKIVPEHVELMKTFLATGVSLNLF